MGLLGSQQIVEQAVVFISVGCTCNEGFLSHGVDVGFGFFQDRKHLLPAPCWVRAQGFTVDSKTYGLQGEAP